MKKLLHGNFLSLAVLISSAETAETEKLKKNFSDLLAVNSNRLTFRRSCLYSLSGREVTRFIALTTSFSNLSPILSAEVHVSVLLKHDELVSPSIKMR